MVEKKQKTPKVPLDGNLKVPLKLQQEISDEAGRLRIFIYQMVERLWRAYKAPGGDLTSTTPSKELSEGDVLDMLGGVQSKSPVRASDLQELEAALNVLLRFGRHTKSHALTLLAMLTQNLASYHEPQEAAGPAPGHSSADQIEPHPGLTEAEGLVERHRQGAADPPRDEEDVQDAPGATPKAANKIGRAH